MLFLLSSSSLLLLLSSSSSFNYYYYYYHYHHYYHYYYYYYYHYYYYYYCHYSVNNISYQCDITCAGHFTLDALASRTVACIHLLSKKGYNSMHEKPPHLFCTIAVISCCWMHSARDISEEKIRIIINIFWPNKAMWQHISKSILAEVMACCLTAPSHYLNQCWLISKVQWHSSEMNCTSDPSAIKYWNELENYCIGSGNGLLPDGTKSLPEPVLTY